MRIVVPPAAGFASTVFALAAFFAGRFVADLALGFASVRFRVVAMTPLANFKSALLSKSHFLDLFASQASQLNRVFHPQ